MGGRRRRDREPARGNGDERGNGGTQALHGRPPEHGDGSMRP
jgi:hypothetical protein